MRAGMYPILTSLRERKLDQVGAAYAVAGWILIQAASIALPAYEAPAWILRWLIAAAFIGFPVALLFAWVMNKPHAATQASLPLKRREAVLLALVGLVALLTLSELAWHWSRHTEMTAQADYAPAAGSIAVLPFANTSGDPKQKYFSEGISEELIGLLARNAALRVAARTSSFFFEGKSLDIRTIAQKLNVRTILEGSVREDGDHVRIEADLINAADGYQLWSQSYDRSLTDILSLQSDIATAIAQALAPQILGGSARPVLPKAGPIDPDAYRMYLEGQFYFAKRSDEDVDRALILFQQVAALAPDFANGQAALAYASMIVHVRKPEQTGVDEQFHQALSRALQLDPANPQALTVAIFYGGLRWDWDTVIAKALALKRTGQRSAVALHGLFGAYDTFALRAPALVAEREAARLDPLSVVTRENLAEELFRVGRWREGIAATDDVLALHPDDADRISDKCAAFAQMKDFPHANDMLIVLSALNSPHFEKNFCLLVIAAKKGQAQIARALAEDAAAHQAQYGLDEEGMATIFAMAGEFDRAMDWLERAFDKKDSIFDWYQSALVPDGLFKTPRWIALTQRPAFKNWLDARERAIRELNASTVP